PGGNATGFAQFEYSMSGKWLELLKEIVPGVMRVGGLRDAANPAGSGQLGAIRAAASSFRVELSPVSVRDPGAIGQGLGAFARAAHGGLTGTPPAMTVVHRDVISRLAARHRLPAVSPLKFFAKDGGLISYGPDVVDQFRRAAGYVGRILKGEKPADLPVQ